MRTRRLSLVALVVVSVSALAACFGGDGGSSGPLSKHFDDMYIAGVPMDQKQEMIRAQNDWSIAKFEKAKAEADFNDAGTQLELAKNEQKSAKLKEDSAKLEKKDADKSADQNKINTAMRAFKAAEKLRKAAEVRVKYLSSYREYLKKQVRYTTDNMYWREAEFELAKAKIATSNNIRPKGFVVEQYTAQEQDRGKRANEARGKAENERQKALGERNKWTQIQGEADQMVGSKNQLPDPMAPKAVQGSDMSRGAGGVTIGGGTTPTSTDGDGDGNGNGNGTGAESSPQ